MAQRNRRPIRNNTNGTRPRCAIWTALAKERTGTKVHLAYQTAAGVGFVLPAALVLAYESRLAELERKRKRRTWLAVMCVFAVVCVLSALTLWELERRERHMHAKDEAVRLSGMIQMEQWDEAQRALDRVSPEMLRFSELSGVAKQVKDGVRREQRRRQDFTQRLQQVETRLDQLGSASSLEWADSRLAELTKLIGETTAQLALGEQEKRRLQTLAQTAASQRKTMQDAWNEAFAERSRQVEARLTSLEQELGTTVEQLALLVPTAIVEAQSLRKRLEQAGKEVETLLQRRTTVDSDGAQLAMNQEQRQKQTESDLGATQRGISVRTTNHGRTAGPG